MSLKKTAPDFSLEIKIEGPVCGLDEAGRGPLAGPVVAACVVIPHEKRRLHFVRYINDSKQVPYERREELFDCITTHFHYGIAEISPEEIDDINILQASMKAMKNALAVLLSGAHAVHALVDGNHCPDLPCPTTPVIKGDGISKSIAAASILAKVTRDRLMKKLALDHPVYGWDSNAGYPTPAHLDAINRHGITPHHRKSFAPVRHYIEFGTIERKIALSL